MIGALMLIDTDVPGYGIPLPLIAAVVVFSVAFVFGVSRLALRARRRPVVTGSEGLIGSLGVMLDAGPLPGGVTEDVIANANADASANAAGIATTNATTGGMLAGWAQVQGERWRVSSTAPVAVGQAVRVTARRGLTLTVVPAEVQQQGEHT